MNRQDANPLFIRRSKFDVQRSTFAFGFRTQSQETGPKPCETEGIYPYLLRALRAFAVNPHSVSSKQRGCHPPNGAVSAVYAVFSAACRYSRPRIGDVGCPQFSGIGKCRVGCRPQTVASLNATPVIVVKHHTFPPTGGNRRHFFAVVRGLSRDTQQRPKAGDRND